MGRASARLYGFTAKPAARRATLPRRIFSGERSMQQDVFETELRAAGYTAIEAKTIDPRPANTGHAHDYDIRGLVLDGLFIVIRDGKPETYRPGDVFAVPAGKSHSEEIGPRGARIVTGRKY
jgi:quercetin dioxygenase-like cupin family protein